MKGGYSFPARSRTLLRWLAPAFGLVALAACGGGSSSSSGFIPPSAAATGTIAWSINDAAGDFTNYAVGLKDIKLTRDDGVVVEALPAPVNLDLAQLVDMSQLFGTVSLPSGTYTSMEIDVDYTNAQIAAENDQGQVVDLTPVTSGGGAAGVVAITVKFTGDDALVVSQGTPLLASLDFDLAASNSIDFNASPPTVTVAPLFYATADPLDVLSSRASGTLISVDTAASTYDIDIVPLFYTGTNDFGSLKVSTDAQTAFSVDGTQYVGATGLQAMDSLPAASPTLAYGTYQPASGSFSADEVLAGSSVPGVDSDVVQGSVTARSGNVLTVRGVTFVQATGEQIYHSIVTVSIGAGTIVYKAAEPSAQVGIGDISVGQRVTVLGTLTDTDPGSLAMDAGLNAPGYVRLEPSRVSGTVVAVGGAQLTLDLYELNRHPVDWFDFSGTGATSGEDADPSNYEIDAGTEDLSGLVVGQPGEVEGFVQPFGQAPPDFNAESVGNFQSSGSHLMVGWRPDGTATPFSTANSSSLVIDLQDPNLGPFAELRRGGVPTELASLPASPSIVPPGGGTGLYAIRKSGTVTIYVSFSQFVSAVQSQLGSSVMIGLFGQGGYDSATNTYTAQRLSVILR